MTMDVAKGLDAAILDLVGKRMMANILPAKTRAGRDRFFVSSIKGSQ